MMLFHDPYGILVTRDSVSHYFMMSYQGPAHRCIRGKIRRMLCHGRGDADVVKWISLVGSLCSLHSYPDNENNLMPTPVPIYIMKYCDKNILIIHRSFWKSKITCELITNVFSIPNGDGEDVQLIKSSRQSVGAGGRCRQCFRLAGTDAVRGTEKLVMMCVMTACLIWMQTGRVSGEKCGEAGVMKIVIFCHWYLLNWLIHSHSFLFVHSNWKWFKINNVSTLHFVNKNNFVFFHPFSALFCHLNFVILF